MSCTDSSGDLAAKRYLSLRRVTGWLPIPFMQSPLQCKLARSAVLTWCPASQKQTPPKVKGLWLVSMTHNG